jgi:hypothetical protein
VPDRSWEIITGRHIGKGHDDPGAGCVGPARGLGSTLGRPVPRQRQRLLPHDHRNGYSERGAERQR